MARRTRSSRRPRRRSCFSTIARRSASQSGIIATRLYNSFVSYQVTLIPGDGIGPEVAEATLRAIEATGVRIEWDRVEAGINALQEYGELLPNETIASLEMNRVGPKGPTATPIGGRHQSI